MKTKKTTPELNFVATYVKAGRGSIKRIALLGKNANDVWDAAPKIKGYELWRVRPSLFEPTGPDRNGNVKYHTRMSP
jgi:hypothetical protein